MSVPQEPGLYWARTFRFEWWNLIVRVQGESPFLKSEVVLNRSGGAGIGHHEIIWGPKIEEPAKPQLSDGERWGR